MLVSQSEQHTLTRLLPLGFSLLLLCLVITIGTNLAVNTQHQKSTNLLINHLYPARRSSETVLRLALTIDDEGAWYILSHNPHQQVQLLNSYQQDIQALHAAIANSRKLADTPPQRAALDDLSRYFFGNGGYTHTNHDAFVFKQDGQDLTASDTYVNSPFLPTIQQDMQIYNTAVEREIAQEDATQQALARLVLLLDIGVGGSVVLFGFAIAVVITRTIHRLYYQLEEKNSRLQTLSTTDPLTELPNHRSLVSRLQQEMERAQHSNSPCSLLFLDLDHFKALNDTYGHQMGDCVLSDFSGVLQQSMRSMDIAGRWGGEEFVAILPETSAEEAVKIAESIRTAVSFHPFGTNKSLHLTCSIGVACYPEDGHDQKALINVADQAMYGAKHLGRNQIRHANDPAVIALLTQEKAAGGREEISLRGTVEALVTLVEGRDGSLGHHSQLVSDLASQLAYTIGLPQEEVQGIALAALLHDIGKVAIADAILQKPGPLTTEEWVQMRRHSLVGANVLEHIPSLRPLAPAIRAHHEYWNGQGYPDHLHAEQIPLAARLIGVVDAYMVMITERPYQQARSSAEACAELQRCAGTQFDPKLVEALINLLQQTHDHEPSGSKKWQGVVHR